MRKSFLLTTTILSITNANADERISYDAGVMIASIMDSRSFGTVGINTASLSKIYGVPFIDIAYDNGSRISYTLSYSYIHGLKNEHIAPSSDVYGTGGIVIFTNTRYNINENIHQLSFVPAIKISRTSDADISIGPSLDAFYTQANIVGRGIASKELSQTSYRLGARFMMSKRYSDRWRWDFFYKVNSDIQLLGISFRRDL